MGCRGQSRERVILYINIREREGRVLKRMFPGVFGWLFVPFMIMSLNSNVSPVSMPSAFDDEDRKYEGVLRCKMCHKREKKGMQYEIWTGSSHSKAYLILGTPEAKEIAGMYGVKNPQEDLKCMICHATGFDAPPELQGRKFDITEGVGCESCHGAGGDYYRSKVMRGLRKGSIKPESVGLIYPDENTCKKCHNPENHTSKEFIYEERWAKIAHPIP